MRKDPEAGRVNEASQQTYQKTKMLKVSASVSVPLLS